MASPAFGSPATMGPWRVVTTSMSTSREPRTRTVSRDVVASSHSPRELVSERAVVRAFSEALDVEVLIVGGGVGDAPGHGTVVAEVMEAGQSGEGEADHVELGA